MGQQKLDLRYDKQQGGETLELICDCSYECRPFWTFPLTLFHQFVSSLHMLAKFLRITIQTRYVPLVSLNERASNGFFAKGLAPCLHLLIVCGILLGINQQTTKQPKNSQIQSNQLAKRADCKYEYENRKQIQPVDGYIN